MAELAPFFSVVVPTCDRPGPLAACLAALARLEYPRERFEVIVVDDGGSAPAADVAAAFRHELDLTVLRQENAGPAGARNRGAGMAKHEYLAFTDDDCRPARGWLTAYGRRFAETPGYLLGGLLENGNPGNRFSAASQWILDAVYRHYNADPERARFFASCNLAMAVSVFRALGGFDPRFRTSEDRELCDRSRFQCIPMAFVADAVVTHAHDLTLAQFCRQHFNYGRGARVFYETRARRGSGTVHEVMAFHLNARNWLHYPLGQVAWRDALPLAANLGLWQASNAAGFFVETLYQRLGRGA